jgi:four helix bundle protein
MFNFEKLDSWHRAIDFGDLIYSLTRDFPRDEMFGLTMQMRRAAVSVSSNLAEGSSRSSHADFARFTELSAGSLFEVVSQSVIAKRRGFLKESDFLTIYGRPRDLARC